LVADPIVRSGNLWMMKAVVSGGATASVVDAYTGHAVCAAGLLDER
jgi:hypothetical protein